VALCREFEPLLSEPALAVAGLPGADPERHRQSVLRYRRLQSIGDFFVEATRYPISANVAGLFKG